MQQDIVKPLPRKQATHVNRSDATLSCKAFLLGELIGEDVEVVWSSKGPQALAGKIVDETQNTFVLSTITGEKTVPKKGSVFYFPRTNCKVDGSVLAVKPEERTKRLAKKL